MTTWVWFCNFLSEEQMACKQLSSLQNPNNLKNCPISKLHLKLSSHHAKSSSSTFYFENLSDTYIFRLVEGQVLSSLAINYHYFWVRSPQLLKPNKAQLFRPSLITASFAGPRSPTHSTNCSVAPQRLPAAGGGGHTAGSSARHAAPRHRPQASPAPIQATAIAWSPTPPRTGCRVLLPPRSFRRQSTKPPICGWS